MIRAGIIFLCMLCEYVARVMLKEYITLSYNPGVAFGIFKGVPGLSLYLSAVLIAMITFMIYFTDFKPIVKIGMSVMAGGALSNLLERIFLGSVIDWIPLPFYGLYFNLADVEIAIGAAITILSVMKQP